MSSLHCRLFFARKTSQFCFSYVTADQLWQTLTKLFNDESSIAFSISFFSISAGAS